MVRVTGLQANSTETPALVVYASPAGPSAADLIPLESWFKAGTGHYVVGSDEGKAEAAATGYTKVGTLGYVWPPPGTENATSRYGLPSISKDDKDYIDQNYWHGRTVSPPLSPAAPLAPFGKKAEKAGRGK